ncbi:hypothetical protein NL676_005196 [Syzygium grande]|nr:hypothetical protein NL676_005196 [Syzygium grande]
MMGKGPSWPGPRASHLAWAADEPGRRDAVLLYEWKIACGGAPPELPERIPLTICYLDLLCSRKVLSRSLPGCGGNIDRYLKEQALI